MYETFICPGGCKFNTIFGKIFLVICRGLGLLESYEGKGGDDDASNLEGSKQTLPLLTKPPPSVALSVNEFVEYANKEDEVLRSLFPGESLSLLNSGEENRKISWAEMKSYWWKNCSNSRTPGIINNRREVTTANTTTCHLNFQIQPHLHQEL